MARPPQGRTRKPAGAGGLGAGGFIRERVNEFKGTFRYSYMLQRFDLDDRLRLAMAARDRGDHREERKLLKAWAARGLRERLISSWRANH